MMAQNSSRMVKKLDLIEKLIRLSDTTTINKIDKLLNNNGITNYEAKLKPMTGEEFKARIEKSEDDFKNGRVISHEDLKKEAENW